MPHAPMNKDCHRCGAPLEFERVAREPEASHTGLNEKFFMSWCNCTQADPDGEALIHESPVRRAGVFCTLGNCDCNEDPNQ